MMQNSLLADGLMAHQVEGVQHLLDNPRAMLAWEMGVGKTAPAVRATEAIPNRDKPALVLCLASARENWRKEIARFAIDKDFPPRVQVLKDTVTPLEKGVDFIITNYDRILQKPIASRLRVAGGFSALILDEAHMLKTPDAKRTHLVYGGGTGPGAFKQTPLMEFAERIWPLTGTPMPNHPGELFTHAHALWPQATIYNGKPMEYWQWELGFCQTRVDTYGSHIVGGRNLKELKERLGPYVSRLLRKDVLDLPPLTVDTWPLDAERTSGANEEYEKGPPELRARLDAIGLSIEQFDQLTLDHYLSVLHSEAVHLATLRRDVGLVKAVLALLTIREEMAEGAPKTLIFAYHRDVIEFLTNGLKSFGAVSLHGSTPSAKREEAIEKFQTDPKCRVFVGQLTAAGSSINLQAAENVVFVEASWVPGENDQAYSRAYRAGQTKPVYVRFFYLKGSIDESISRACARKAAMISQVLN